LSFPMKCHFRTFVLLPIFLFCPIWSLAADSFSSSRVEVSSNASSTHTSIRIETNGEVKTYESDSPGSVLIESSDASVKAKAIVNNLNVNTTFSSVTPTKVKPTITPIQSLAKIEEQPNYQKAPDIFSRIRSFFESLLKRISL
jgi:hypothetical protein